MSKSNEYQLRDGQWWMRYQIGDDEFGPWHKIYWRDAMRAVGDRTDPDGPTDD